MLQASARSIAEALEELAPDQISVNIVDVFVEHAGFPFNRFPKMYQVRVNHGPIMAVEEFFYRFLVRGCDIQIIIEYFCFIFVLLVSSWGTQSTFYQVGHAEYLLSGFPQCVHGSAFHGPSFLLGNIHMSGALQNHNQMGEKSYAHEEMSIFMRRSH